MTLTELDHSLPDGFHDSALKGLIVDYERRVAILEMSLCVGDCDGPRKHRDDCRPARIEFAGVVLLVLDPPDGTYDFSSSGEIWMWMVTKPGRLRSASRP